jgi:putative phosphoesterase
VSASGKALPTRTPARIGLLGDIHAEDEALDQALAVFAEANVDSVMAVGDIVDGPGHVERCCARLAEVGAIAVRGNHERWFLAGTLRDLPGATLRLDTSAHRFVASLPATRRFEVPGGEIVLCHGLGEEDMASVALDADALSIPWNPPLNALFAEDRRLWVLNGHTHLQGVWSHGNVTVINGGTLLRKADPCFSIVDLARGEVTYFDVRGRDQGHKSRTLRLPAGQGAR